MREKKKKMEKEKETYSCYHTQKSNLIWKSASYN